MRLSRSNCWSKGKSVEDLIKKPKEDQRFKMSVLLIADIVDGEINLDQTEKL